MPLKKLLPEAFGLAREASRRTTGMTPFKVQLIGGMAMFEGGIAEMQTGEGKTLTAVLTAPLARVVGTVAESGGLLRRRSYRNVSQGVLFDDLS